MTELFENIQKPETAVLVGVDLGEYDCEASLDELEELAKTAGAEVEARVTQRRETPDSATFIGSGRLKEIKNFCADNDVDLLIFDSELTPSQQRNIEDITDVRVVDRTQLILDIFAARARSGEGKLQVELAQLKYLLPRLGGKGTSMSRLGGTAQRQDIRAHGRGTGQAFKRDGQGTAAHAQKGHAPAPLFYGVGCRSPARKRRARPRGIPPGRTQNDRHRGRKAPRKI